MEEEVHIFLFGDQTYQLGSELSLMLCFSDDPFLESFLNKAFCALRSEIAKLPEPRRKQLPSLSSLPELLALPGQGPTHTAISQVLTCIYHLASFIRYAKSSATPEDPTSRSKLLRWYSYCTSTRGSYPRASSSFALGICTGALAAAAVSCCDNLSELLPVAIYTTQLAFRVGLYVTGTADSIEPSSSTTGFWSCVMVESDVNKIEETLSLFSKELGLPLTSKPYVSAFSSHSVSISGPPSILSKFEKDPASRGLHTSQLELHAPYHAPHLYDEQNLDSLLSSLEDLSGFSTYFPVISSSNGRLRRPSSLASTFRAALADILINRIDWNLVNERLSLLTGVTLNSQTQIHSIGITAGKARIQTLSEGGQCSSSHNGPEKASHISAPLSNGLADPLLPTSNPTTVNGKSKIAILGMSGRFPGADSPSEFWNVLVKGLDVHSIVPASRWDAATHVDLSGKRKNTSTVPYGCWLKHADLFDPKFFNISPREAPQIDPAQRIALLTAYEAIEQAGIVPNGSPSTQKDRVGVFYGVTSNDWMETNSAQDIDTYFIPGGNRAFISGRINYFFKFSGPSYSVDTACSSSLAAIHIACNSLWQRDVDTAIAGGTNILTNPDFTSGLDRGHFLSQTGNCKTFDDTADGYCRGEGAGTVILKRLDDALFDNDPILGVICDVSTNHNAEAQSITRPCVDAQKDLFRNILRNTHVDLHDISYVEMHGTGTQVGDAGEVESVLETLAPSSCLSQRRLNAQPLYLGSAKANVGHGEAAAGISSLIKAILMMQNNAIPPHCGIKTKINQRFPTDLKDRGVHIAAKEIHWPRNGTDTRKLLLNNFSAAGGNSALLLEDAPAQLEHSMVDPRSSHVVTISAKSATALRRNTESLLSYLDSYSTSSVPLPALSFTTTARRIHHRHRLVASGSDLSQIRSRLRAALEHGIGSTRAKASTSILFAFTGQGSLYAGVGEQLLSNFSYFRADIDRLDGLAKNFGFPSVRRLIEYSKYQIDDRDPVCAQLALVIFEMALFRLWMSWGIRPHSIIGHSLGTYAALNAAGVISDADTVYLVGRRAQLLRDNCQHGTHSMLAVRATAHELQSYLRDTGCEIASFNSPKDCVVSGDIHAIREIRERLNNSSIQATELTVSFAYHSSQMDPVLKKLEQIASAIPFHRPLIPVICPLYGEIIAECGIFGPKYLASHCRSPVNMMSALNAAQASHIVTESTITLEVGPQPVVSRMIKTSLGPHMQTLSSSQQGQDMWPILTEALSCLYSAGGSISWAEYHRDFLMSHKVLRLPAYGWDLQSYWISYRNDWSLRKGDPLQAHQEIKQKTLESTTIHRVVQEEIYDQTGVLIVEADISRPDISKFVQGHKVNGIPLCTPSVYVDIALTAARYLIDKYRPQQNESVIDVSDMTIIRALVAHGQGPQFLRVSIEVEWPLGMITCRFSSLNHRTQTFNEHGHCTLRLKIAARELASLEAKAASATLNLSRLHQGLIEGKTYRFNLSMIYKMIAAVAEFDPQYRAIDNIILDSNALEACGNVSYNNRSDDGLFHIHPGILDALSQIGGFVMNANDSADLHKEVYVNHGWKSFQMFKDINAGKSYQTHVKMEPRPGNIWEGDIMIFEAGRVVACFKGITLQKVLKRQLHYILSKEVPSQPHVKLKAMENSAPTPTNTHCVGSYEGTPSHAINQPLINTHSSEHPESRSNDDTITTRHSPTTIEIQESKTSRKIKLALDIIAEESGIAVSDLFDESKFIDIGIDSLLVLILVGRFNEELEVGVPPSILMEGTIRRLKEYFGGDTRVNENSLPTTYSPANNVTTDQDSVRELSPLSEPLLVTPQPSDYPFDENKPSCRPATSVVLQGDVHRSEKILMLFPDGSGSATSYIHLPRLGPDLAVVGFNSPFVDSPSEMACCTFNPLITAYIDELRRRRRHGPYYLAGWSSGGILAYHAAQLLLEQGEPVVHLVLMDSPAPLDGLDRLPEGWYHHFASKNLYGGMIPNASPQASKDGIKRVIGHFKATIEMLRNYRAKPLSADCGVRSTIIWAMEASLERKDIEELVAEDGDTEGLRFLTDRKTDLSTRGWEQLLPLGTMAVEGLVNANHFSMMHGDHARCLVSLLARTMK